MRRAAAVMIAGAAVWIFALLIGPLLRPDLDPVTTHPEAWAIGPWAPVMRAGYLGIAGAGAGAAILVSRQRIAASLLLVFAVGALVIGLLPPGSGALADAVFPVAQLAPLALLPAMVLVSLDRRDPALRWLAVLTVGLFFPLVLGEPPAGGLINRAADLAMGAWLGALALSGRSGTGS